MAARDWRFILTDLDTVTLSFLDRVAHDRRVVYTLNDEAIHEGRVPSDHAAVNSLAADGDPYLSMNNRLVYGFRREGSGENPPVWVVRFAGILQLPGDSADTDEPDTHYTAYDPWRILKQRPLVRDDGKLPTDGITFRNTRGDVMVTTLLENSFVWHGNHRIDFGQTDFYEGTIEATEVIDQAFEAQSTIGQALTTLTDRGTLDVVLKPIYDPVNRPGYLAELNVFEKAGQPSPNAIFAWDKPGRTLTGIERVQDGTRMANKVLFYTGNGQPVALQTNAESVTKYGQYWFERSISDDYVKAAVVLLARVELRLLYLGHTTISVTPTPVRAPEPFLEFNLGDKVPVWASRRLRQMLAQTDEQPWRVYGIPIEIADDGIEQLESVLLASPFEEIDIT